MGVFIKLSAIFLRMLDKDVGIMVKYPGIEYRVDREEYPHLRCLRESGSLAESPGGHQGEKVRPGADLPE